MKTPNEKYAIRFNTTPENKATSYSVIPYVQFVRDIKDANHKVQLFGYETATAAELDANALVGSELAEALKTHPKAATEEAVAQIEAVETGTEEEPDAEEEPNAPVGGKSKRNKTNP